MSVQTQQSLVKYSTPVLVSVAGKKGKDKKKNVKDLHRTEDILSEILPPKEYTYDNGQLWIQTVLSTPATRTEVIALQEEMDKKLTQRQARETGICPIREELFEQCFDELIRQITIDCRQRGLLLVRVRDEFRSQLDAYKNLYESSIAYGMRKMIDSEQRNNEMHTTIMVLEKECQELSKDVEELNDKIKWTKETEEKRLEQENDQHKQKVEKLKKKNNNLKEELQSLLEDKKP